VVAAVAVVVEEAVVEEAVVEEAVEAAEPAGGPIGG
jgi:hypothetical protein